MGIRQGQSIRGSVVAAASLLMFCIPIPRAARADIVHLKNGRAMEGMILEESPEQVLLRLPFGEIGFPRASVLRIDRGKSAFEEFLDLRLELQREDGTASEWLELAQWAEREGLDHSAREATLIAARLDPGLPGLVPWLPGVRLHPDRPETLVVDTHVARVLPLQVLHLLGFRKLRWQRHVLLVSRRRFDTRQ